MKRSKKWLGMAMAAVMMGSMAVPVLATGTTSNDTLTVGYTEASTYTLNIPASVTLKETEEVSQSIGLSAINVATTEKVQIKVKSGISNGNVALTDAKDSENKCTSTVSLSSGGAGIGDNAVVAEFEGTGTTATMGGTLFFSKLGDIPAGTYSGTITFEAGIVTE